ncbi:hypothetical protein [Agarivorans sp. 1_MG-2023]|uniref:hypothetical protein n=1 Tax=Agarivorans sp. 1_MG-2023 TaxID=3062634 RepID=UPI0026E1DE9F|nr:hypothetical protein [Agarivorans sp. 1_MG-2023]MDO6766086.1 hypothetical protein [Agarivorans sp. 1_MG-2023]
MNIETNAQTELREVLALASQKGRTRDGSFVMKQLQQKGWKFKTYIKSSDIVSKTSHACGYQGCYGTGVMHKIA